MLKVMIFTVTLVLGFLVFAPGSQQVTTAIVVPDVPQISAVSLASQI